MQTVVTTRGTGAKITIRSTRPGTVRLVGRTQVVAVGTTPKAPHVINVKPKAA